METVNNFIRRSGRAVLTALLLCPAGLGLAQEPGDLRITDVGYIPGQGVRLEFSHPGNLAGSEWAVYSCDVLEAGNGGEPVTWTLAEDAIVLVPDEPFSWMDIGQGGRLSIEDCPVRLYLVRRVDEDVSPQSLVLRASLGPAGESGTVELTVDALRPEQVARLLRVGFDSAEGFSLGTLDNQEDWTCVGEVTVQQDLVDAGDQAVALRGPKARMTRKVISDGSSRATIEMSVYVSKDAGVQAAKIALPPRTSSSIAFHPRSGFFAFDGDGAGGGRWVVVPDSIFLDQWVDLVIVNDYETKQWSITVQGQAELAGLGFRNDELEHIEEINLYAGNNQEMLVDSIAVRENMESN